MNRITLNQGFATLYPDGSMYLEYQGKRLSVDAGDAKSLKNVLEDDPSIPQSPARENQETEKIWRKDPVTGRFYASDVLYLETAPARMPPPHSNPKSAKQWLRHLK